MLKEHRIEKLHEGDRVQWKVKPNGGEEFKATGIVREIKTSTFGGKKRGKGASIEVKTKRYWEIYSKKIAFVGVDKLTVLD